MQGSVDEYQWYHYTILLMVVWEIVLGIVCLKFYKENNDLSWKSNQILEDIELIGQDISTNRTKF